jgi:hypothetical protein
MSNLEEQPTRRTSGRPGLTGFLEERFLVPAYSSPRAPLWVAAHRTLSVPLQVQGAVYHFAGCREGQDLRIIGIGRRKRFEPLLRRLFGEVKELQGATTISVTGPAAFSGLEADLVVAEVHRWVASGFRNSGWLLMPDSVRWAGDTATLPPPVLSHSLREDMRKLRRYEYTLEQSTDWSRWQEFYDTMLVPQALSRFGDAAWLPTRRFLRELAARGVLHLVRRDGQWVAGICSVRHGDTLWLPVSGVLNGDPALLQQGVSVALFAQTFAWARRQGVTRIDAGRTTPFVNDGISRSKAKWGLRPVLDPLSHLLALRIGTSEPLRRAFASQPVMTEGLDGLETYAGE